MQIATRPSPVAARRVAACTEIEQMDPAPAAGEQYAGDAEF